MPLLACSASRFVGLSWYGAGLKAQSQNPRRTGPANHEAERNPLQGNSEERLSIYERRRPRPAVRGDCLRQRL